MERALGNARHWHDIAWIHLALNDEPAFRGKCGDLLRNFGQPEQRGAALLVGAAVSHAESDALSAIASCALSQHAAEAELPRNVSAVVYAACLDPRSGLDAKALVELARAAATARRDNAHYKETLGAALYRAGDYKQAATTLAAAFPAGKETNWTRLFLAMALKRQRKDDEAKMWLAKVQPPDEKTSWDQRLIHDRLRAEADALWAGKKETGK